MKTGMPGAVLLAAIAACAGPIGAIAAQDPSPVRVTDQGVLVDFQDADLRLVVTALAETGGLNVVYTDLPTRRVTLRMRQPVPREHMLPLLRSLAQSNGLRLVDDSSFIRLEPAALDQAVAAQVDAVSDNREAARLFVYRLKHVRAARLGGTLQTLFGGAGSGGSRQSAPRAKSLSESLRSQQLVTDNEPKIDLDTRSVKASLPGQLRGEVQIVPDETTNSLLIRAQPSDWVVLQQAIQALDLRPLQVLIEVVIAEVRRTKESEVSVAAVITDTKTDQTVRGTLKGNTSGNLVLEALRTGNLDLKAALSVVASRGNVRIISRPVVLAQNNQEARILIGAERPFVQVSRSLPTDAAVRDQVIQYRDVGTRLTITPTINDEGYVNLQVLQEVSTATAETQFGAPVISTREAATELFVKDGHTAVLGGLIDHQEEKTRSGIPILMQLPVIGGLFGTQRTTAFQSELFLFLTPHVIATDEDSDRIRERIKADAPSIRDAVP